MNIIDTTAIARLQRTAVGTETAIAPVASSIEIQEFSQAPALAQMPIVVVPMFCLMPAVSLMALLSLYTAIYRACNHQVVQKLTHIIALERLLDLPMDDQRSGE